MKKLLFFALLFPFISGCQTNYENLPAYSDSRQLQAVIEIPAGSAHQYFYDPANHSFPIAQSAGQDKVVPYLPYPFNVGFVPSTLFDKKRGGDGKPLDVLVLGESRESGTVMEVTPLAVLLLEENGELDYKIIAVPAKPSERTIAAGDFAEFTGKYPSIKRIIELWFLNYNPTSKTRIMGWKDERFAEAQVQKYLN